MKVGTNVAALSAHRSLLTVGLETRTALERLSSGLRINRAADDAAGLAISETMRGQVGGMRRASENAQDGISLVQTAEGALNETHAMLQRMRVLSVQAANGTLSDSDRAHLQKEVDALVEQIDLGATTTQFNGMALLDGSFAEKSLQVGAGAGDTMTVTIGAARASDLGLAPATETDTDPTSPDVPVNGRSVKEPDLTVPGRLPVRTVYDPLAPDKAWDDWSTLGTAASVSSSTGAPPTGAFTVDGATGEVRDGSGVVGTISGDGRVVTFADSSTVTFDNPVWLDNASASPWGEFTLSPGAPTGPDGRSAISLLTARSARDAIDTLDTAIRTVSDIRAGLGALQNRLDHTIRSLGVAAENLAAAESRIRDTDMARESARLMRGQIVSQAATAMLAQAQGSSRSVLTLLG